MKQQRHVMNRRRHPRECSTLPTSLTLKSWQASLFQALSRRPQNEAQPLNGKTHACGNHRLKDRDHASHQQPLAHRQPLPEQAEDWARRIFHWPPSHPMRLKGMLHQNAPATRARPEVLLHT